MKILITVTEDKDAPEWGDRFTATSDFRGIAGSSSDVERAINYVKGAALICIGNAYPVVPDLIEFEVRR